MDQPHQAEDDGPRDAEHDGPQIGLDVGRIVHDVLAENRRQGLREQHQPPRVEEAEFGRVERVRDEPVPAEHDTQDAQRASDQGEDECGHCSSPSC